MKTLRYPRLLLAAVVMAIVFMVAEFLVEGIAGAALGMSAEKFLQNANLTLSGFRYHVVNILYLYSFCFLAMWLYASQLSRYGSFMQSVVATILFLLTLIVLAATHMVNIRLIPFAAGLTAVVFGVLELAPAIFLGASAYTGSTK